MIDTDVRLTRLDSMFADLARKVRPQDVFVFFIAGHGKTVDGRYYFIPQDFRYDGEHSIVERGISQEKLQAWFATIKAKKSVLMFDTCESGSLTNEQVATRGLERVASLERLTRAMGRTVLSASSDDNPALEGYRGHGVFAYALLDALERGDANGNGFVEVTELAGFIDAEVPEISFKAFNFRQVPQMKIIGSNFPLAKPTAVLATTTDDRLPISRKPTHVVIVPASVRENSGGTGAVTEQLTPGAQVVVMEGADGWVLIARDGRKLGYVEEKTLARLQ